MPIINIIDAIVFNICAFEDVLSFLFDSLLRYFPVKNNRQKETIAEISQNQKSSLKRLFPKPTNMRLMISNIAPITNDKTIKDLPINFMLFKRKRGF